MEPLSLNAAWAPGTYDRVRVHEAGGWADAGPLESERTVDEALLRRLQDRTGHGFVWLRLVPA